ncbi:hypothetical protein U0070_025961 [Myodes glareolus]|uniref:Uncharacterized protein n=1 Tax=Myodes glareolus TaxID=447135 RepID=A0AAW0HC52_MYOGA
MYGETNVNPRSFLVHWSQTHYRAEKEGGFYMHDSTCISMLLSIQNVRFTILIPKMLACPRRAREPGRDGYQSGADSQRQAADTWWQTHGSLRAEAHPMQAGPAMRPGEPPKRPAAFCGLIPRDITTGNRDFRREKTDRHHFNQVIKVNIPRGKTRQRRAQCHDH